MSHFRLKYDYPSVHSSSGSAWVMAATDELSQDCAFFEELERAVGRLYEELDAVLEDGRRAFAATRKVQMEILANADKT